MPTMIMNETLFAAARATETVTPVEAAIYADELDAEAQQLHASACLLLMLALMQTERAQSRTRLAQDWRDSVATVEHHAYHRRMQASIARAGHFAVA